MKRKNRLASRVGSEFGKLFRLSEWGSGRPWRPAEVVTMGDLRRRRAARKAAAGGGHGQAGHHRHAA